MTDEALQSSIERGEPTETKDALAYGVVFKALRREPDFVLSHTFADRVISRLHVSPAGTSRDTFWLFVGVVSCLIIMIVAVILTGFQFKVGAFRFLSGYPGLVAFAVVFILGLQWLDKKVVRKAL
jgi:hypothetical protein